MKIYDKIHVITCELNVEDSAHSKKKKKINLPSKQQEERIKGVKRYHGNTAFRKQSRAHLVSYSTELETTRDIPVLLRMPTRSSDTSQRHRDPYAKAKSQMPLPHTEEVHINNNSNNNDKTMDGFYLRLQSLPWSKHCSD